MDMDPVKITNSKEWSSIDIFLFSNGQQYSPPRKYHLHSEELQRWDVAVSNLGRTHYGSGHSSIQLYTINGTRINGPLELTNGGAYVAVETPDSFINTGYEEYLLRATRSWEKRLAQKSYNTEVINPDLKTDKEPIVQSKTDDIRVLENNTESALLKVENNSTKLLQKTLPTKPYQRRERKSIAGSKQIQKKKSFDTHSVMLKRICTDTDKVIPCPKKTSLKKNGSMNQRSSIIDKRLNETFNRQEQSSCCTKRSSLKPENIDDYRKNSNQSGKTNQLLPVNDELSVKTEESKNWHLYDIGSLKELPNTDLTTKKETCVTTLRQDPELCRIVDNSEQLFENNNVTVYNIPVQHERIHENESYNSKTEEKNSTNELKKTDDNEEKDIIFEDEIQNDEIVRDPIEHIPIINNYRENKIHDNDTDLNKSSEMQVTDEYVAYMNSGGLLLLKLKIKLKDCKTILNKDKNKNTPMATSLSDLPKTEKTSQVDINISFSAEILKSSDKLYTQDNSLHSLLNKLYLEESDHINSKKPRIVILQCACRNYSDNHRCSTCDRFRGCVVGDKKCETMLNPKLNDTFTSCECHTESLGTSKDEYSINNCMKSLNEERLSLSETNGTRVKNLAQKFESSDNTMQTDKKINSNNLQNSKNVSRENHRQSEVLFNGSPEREGSIKNQSRENNNDLNSKSISNKSTQTDWCNVLLEARRHENDSYTFHLPSLFVLKQCDL